MVDAEAVRGGLFGGFAPVGVGFVVEDGVGAEGAEGVGFAVGGGGGDDAGAGGFGELWVVSIGFASLWLPTLGMRRF